MTVFPSKFFNRSFTDVATFVRSAIAPVNQRVAAELVFTTVSVVISAASILTTRGDEPPKVSFSKIDACRLKLVESPDELTALIVIV